MKLIVEKIKKLNKKEIGIYLLVGIAGAIVDFFTFYLLQKYGFNTLFAQWLASFAGFTHNHFWQHFKVFEHNQTLKKTYSISMVISVVSIFISGLALVALTNLGINIWMAKIFILFFITIILYVIRKRFIFIFNK